MDYLDQLINAYWLRPETALWRSIDIIAMKNFSFKSPSLDLECGDGMFQFIRAHGELSSDFDVFQSVANLDNFFANKDVYDFYNHNLNPSVITKPSYLIDEAFDHKINLLNKAKKLGIYKNFTLGDANLSLPYASDSFSSIFSNIIYWLNDPKSAIFEVSRVLKSSGTACLMLPNDTLSKFSFYNNFYSKDNPSWNFLNYLDRGRLADNIKHALPAREWELIFSEAGLDVIYHSQFLSKTVIQIWDIGLRPLFPHLMKMVQSIEHNKMMEIKSDWVKLLKLFIAPISQLDSELNPDVEPAFHCYILSKK